MLYVAKEALESYRCATMPSFSNELEKGKIGISKELRLGILGVESTSVRGIA